MMSLNVDIRVLLNELLIIWYFWFCLCTHLYRLWRCWIWKEPWNGGFGPVSDVVPVCPDGDYLAI